MRLFMQDLNGQPVAFEVSSDLKISDAFNPVAISAGSGITIGICERDGHLEVKCVYNDPSMVDECFTFTKHGIFQNDKKVVFTESPSESKATQEDRKENNDTVPISAALKDELEHIRKEIKIIKDCVLPEMVKTVTTTFGHLKPGATPAQLTAAWGGVMNTIKQNFGDWRNGHFDKMPEPIPPFNGNLFRSNPLHPSQSPENNGPNVTNQYIPHNFSTFAINKYLPNEWVSLNAYPDTVFPYQTLLDVTAVYLTNPQDIEPSCVNAWSGFETLTNSAKVYWVNRKNVTTAETVVIKGVTPNSTFDVFFIKTAQADLLLAVKGLNVNQLVNYAIRAMYENLQLITSSEAGTLFAPLHYKGIPFGTHQDYKMDLFIVRL